MESSESYEAALQAFIAAAEKNAADLLGIAASGDQLAELVTDIGGTDRVRDIRGIADGLKEAANRARLALDGWEYSRHRARAVQKELSEHGLLHESGPHTHSRRRQQQEAEALRRQEFSRAAKREKRAAQRTAEEQRQRIQQRDKGEREKRRVERADAIREGLEVVEDIVSEITSDEPSDGVNPVNAGREALENLGEDDAAAVEAATEIPREMAKIIAGETVEGFGDNAKENEIAIAAIVLLFVNEARKEGGLKRLPALARLTIAQDLEDAVTPRMMRAMGLLTAKIEEQVGEGADTGLVAARNFVERIGAK